MRSFSAVVTTGMARLIFEPDWQCGWRHFDLTALPWCA